MPTILILALGVVSQSEAQVTTPAIYQGRLTDTTGIPQAGPVDLTLRIFDAAIGETLLYSEQHLAVDLGSGGSFAVPLGNGTNPSGSYTTALRTAASLYLEIEVDGDVLSPRQEIASAAVAVAAGEHPAPANRFEACTNGLTIADHQTGLLWEKKTGTFTTPVSCHTSPGGCPDPHDVNNRYRWSTTGTTANGEVFSDFLSKLNDPFFGTSTTSVDVTGCFAGHCSWRLPNVVELRTILDCSDGSPCRDPIFGETVASNYWTASLNATTAWTVYFSDGDVRPAGFNTNATFARAVRTGSCDE